MPFIYDKENWPKEALHPKQLLQNSLQKKYKGVNFQFVPVITKNSSSFLSKLILSYSDQKREFLDVDNHAKNKKDSETKVCLHAYHKVVCEEENK